MVEYIALFIESQDDIKRLKNNEQNLLAKLPKNYHVTFEYNPRNIEIYNDILHKEFNITVIGYGSNGENSAFEVKLSEELKKYYNRRTNDGKLITPHITMSMSRNGKAVNSCHLDFKKITPFKVSGVVRCFEVK